jgi:hypothetical protein
MWYSSELFLLQSNGAVKTVIPSGGKKVNIVLNRNSAQGSDKRAQSLYNAGQ